MLKRILLNNQFRLTHSTGSSQNGLRLMKSSLSNRIVTVFCVCYWTVPFHLRCKLRRKKKEDCTHQPLTAFNLSTCWRCADSYSPINIYRCTSPTQYLSYNETRPRIVKVLQALTPDNGLTGFSIYAVKALSLTPVFVLSSHVKCRTCIIRISHLKIKTNELIHFFQQVRARGKKHRKFNRDKIENVPRVLKLKIFTNVKKDLECSDCNWIRII